MTFVTSFEEDTPANLLAVIQPDIFVKGEGHALEEAPVVRGYGGKIEVNLPRAKA